MVPKEDQASGGLPSDLKVRNRIRVLNAIKDGGIYTATDIAKLTGISRPTVMKSIQYFIDQQVVTAHGKGNSTESGGKKPELYSFVCNKLLLTITLWPDILNIHLCSMDLKKIASTRIETPIKDTPEAAFALIKETSMKMLSEHGYNRSDLYGVSLSTSGTIDYTKGVLKYNARAPQWGSDIPLQDYLRNIFGDYAEIVIENAGKMTGRSELARSEAEENRILVLFSTWGLSACLIERGHVLNGKHSLIGEVGHMVLDPNDGERCGCGGYGCAERMLSAERIRQLLGVNWKRYQNSAMKAVSLEQIDIPALFGYSRKGDPFAREIVAYLAQTYGTLIRNTSLVFDPEVIVFQGDYAHADAYFKKRLEEHLKQFRYYPKQGGCIIEYNTTPLEDLDASGALSCLQRKFFGDQLLYQ